MSAPSVLPINRLFPALRTLCEHPSVSGHSDELRTLADRLAVLLRGLHMHVQVIPTAGAPVVIARREGRSRRTLLLYHQYDTAPPGPWREWDHEPFRLSERDGAIYGSGVAVGKGPLAAHIAALHALTANDGELPCNVVIVADGESLRGSPHLAEALSPYRDMLSADLGLAGAGSRDSDGLPICYSGSKGLLQVSLHVPGVEYPLPTGLASTVRNPLWRLIWALGHIKGDDEDIRIPGFYDAVEGPTRDENIALRRIRLDEAERLAAWGTREFLFGLSGVGLTRAEVTLPTCNVTTIVCEPPNSLHAIPQRVSATIDFHLVPHQQPADILALLRTYLDERGFGDIQTNELPGGYAPVHWSIDHPFVQLTADCGSPIFGRPLHVAMAGPFALPLSVLGGGQDTPILTIGIMRPDNAPFGPNEHSLIDDLYRHGQMLSEVMQRLSDI